MVPDVQGATLQAFTRQHVQKGGTLYSDDNRAYSRFGHVARHLVVRHSIGEYVRGQAHIKRHGIVLVDDEAGVPRDLPPDEPEAPPAVR